MIIILAIVAAVVFLWSTIRSLLPAAVSSVGDSIVLMGHKTAAKGGLATAGWLFSRWGDTAAAAELSALSAKTSTWTFTPAPVIAAPVVSTVTQADLAALKADLEASKAEIAALKAKVPAA